MQEETPAVTPEVVCYNGTQPLPTTMYTEDDTFRKLRQTPFEEFHRLFTPLRTEYLFSSMPVDRIYEFCNLHSWDYFEYMEELKKKVNVK